MTKLRIIKEFDDHEPVVLGLVGTEWGEVRAQEAIEKSWYDFQKTHPNTDSEFIAYLVEEHGFREIKDDFIDVTV